MKNASGFGFIEIIVALGLFSLCLLMVTSLVEATDGTAQKIQMSAAKARVSNSLINLAGLAASLRASLMSHDENEALDICINGGDSTCKNDQPFSGFRLYYPFIQVIGPTEIVTSSAITGTPASPLRYNLSGQICDTATETCPAKLWPIEAVTEFSPTCPPIFDSVYDSLLRGGVSYGKAIYPDGLKPGAECPYARFIRVRLTIRSSVDSSSGATPNFLPIVKTLIVDAERVRARI